ncbi:MAG: TetR/AcrR family transcriptional regulator, partial [Pseudomonadota bacterium]
MTDLAPEWIEPTQARSREKVQKIVDAARRRVVETQSLDLKMTDIARAAGVAVGTLYQFFPSRTALIQKLFAEEMRVIDASVAETFLSLS